MVASADARGAVGCPCAGAGPPPPRREPVRGPLPERLIVGTELVVLVGSVAAAALLSHHDQWTPPELVGLLAVLVIGSDFLTLSAKRFRISGSFLGLVLMMALLGPAPAVALGLAAAVVDAVRWRTRGSYLISNLATYAFFPLLGGLLLRGCATPAAGAYALVVVAVFMAVNLLNFVLIAGHSVLLRGGSLPTLLRTVFVPVLPWGSPPRR